MLVEIFHKLANGRRGKVRNQFVKHQFSAHQFGDGVSMATGSGWREIKGHNKRATGRNEAGTQAGQSAAPIALSVSAMAAATIKNRDTGTTEEQQAAAKNETEQKRSMIWRGFGIASHRCAA